MGYWDSIVFLIINLSHSRYDSAIETLVFLLHDTSLFYFLSVAASALPEAGTTCYPTFTYVNFYYTNLYHNLLP